MSNTIQNGKGSKVRGVYNDIYRNNYDDIFRKEIKKTSEEWCKELNIIVYAADGWDRRPEYFEQSWAEKVSEEEFNKRACVSTCQFPPGFFKQFSK